MDIDDAGPSLRAGRFAMRVTNVGVLGNAFFDKGLSNDPSFEFPVHSGQELLNYAALWVGARGARGAPRVSGGPLLEWRPTPDPDDRVRGAWAGQLGTRWQVDDDGDGAIDEEHLNGVDDDDDGEVDEDLGFSSQQIFEATYVDDRPEAVHYVYENGETHEPLGLGVRQQAFAWTQHGYDSMAGVEFTVTNHGRFALEQVYLGLFVDADSRRRSETAGHLNDRVFRRSYQRTIFEGTYRTSAYGRWQGNPQDPSYPDFSCFTNLSGQAVGIEDGRPGTDLPVIAVLPLDHTTDPMAGIVPGAARAPARASFRTSVFARSESGGRGGPPVEDGGRYEALAGRLATSDERRPDDYAVLVSCGPFRRLEPGQSLTFAVALIAAAHADSLPPLLANAAALYHGTHVNLLPDSLGPNRYEWNVGETGLNGHELCLAAPPGVTLVRDPHCGEKFASDLSPGPFSPDVVYPHDRCIWTDADCDGCTGLNGNETQVRWLHPGALPAAPAMRLTPGDRRVTIAWDNMPEVLIGAGIGLPPRARFAGYRVYKLYDWSDRESLLPPQRNWALFGAFGPDSTFSERPLAGIVDPAVDYERILYEQRLYPVGRYSVVDHDVLNGFDYAYVVTTVIEIADALPGYHRVQRFESPMVASFDRVVSPQQAARDAAHSVWVVPNPFRADAHWDRPPVLGDELTRHIDFFGLPRAPSTIRIWTVAGDFVAQIDHDGTAGDGQASWNLVSRNGQDVVSGIYLFTVDSPLGQATGRFVIVR